MKKARVKVLKDNKWQVEGDLVLKNEKLRVEIIWLYYNMLIAGYNER